MCETKCIGFTRIKEITIRVNPNNFKWTEGGLMKNYLIIWRIFVFIVAFFLYFLNVISREILWAIVVGFFVFVMLPEIIVNVWKKRHKKMRSEKMKKVGSLLLSFCLALTLVLPAAPSSTNAQEAINHLEDSNEKNIFTDSFIETVDEFIEISDKEFKITNKLSLRKRLTNEEFIALNEQIELINSQIREFGKENLIVQDQGLVSHFDFEEVDGNIITTYSTKEGINNIEFKIWGYKIWLSKSTVKKILNVGTSGGGAALGAALGNVPGALIGTVVGSILSEFVNPSAARAIYMEVVYPVVVMKVKFQ